MSWITALTGLLGAFNPIIGVVGAGLGSLVTYFVGQYLQRKREQAAAVTSMDQDMDQHSGDGALSVSDMKGAESQLQDLNNQALEIDKQAPVIITKGTP